jgi:hypothetical protein
MYYIDACDACDVCGRRGPPFFCGACGLLICEAHGGACPECGSDELRQRRLTEPKKKRRSRFIPDRETPGKSLSF